MKKVLLYSGGMDSWLIDKIWKPDIKLYIDVNSRYSKEEISKLPKDVIIEKLDLGKWERDDAIIPLRNLYLVMVASNYGEEICLGATAGDRVLDKSFEFGEKVSDLLSYLYQPQHWTKGKEIKINLDFKNYTKKQLIELYLKQGGDLKKVEKETFSCYNPTDGKECWKCKPCFRKFVALKAHGYEFDAQIEKTAKDYIRKEILPEIANGTYGRGQEEEQDILNIFKDEK